MGLKKYIEDNIKETLEKAKQAGNIHQAVKIEINVDPKNDEEYAKLIKQGQGSVYGLISISYVTSNAKPIENGTVFCKPQIMLLIQHPVKSVLDEIMFVVLDEMLKIGLKPIQDMYLTQTTKNGWGAWWLFETNKRFKFPEEL